MTRITRGQTLHNAQAGLLLSLLLFAGCTGAECAFGDHGSAQCRVAAENHYARMLTPGGVELRFHAVGETDASSWDAHGVFEMEFGGVVKARPAGLTDFVFSADRADGDATEVTVVLENVASDVALTRDGIVIPFDGVGTARTVTIPLSEDVVWIRGERPCADAYRIVAGGDVQTGPTQFERIVESLHAEQADADADGEQLLGLLLLGDLAEEPAEDELRLIETILRRSPVPVAVTPGNHDVHGDEMALFNRIYGPGNHAFDACRTRVALVDTGGANLAESIEARLPEFLEREGDEFLIAGTHYPAWSGRTGNGWRDEPVAWRFLAELARHDADLLIAGHYHNWRDYPRVQVGDREVPEILSGTLGATQGQGAPHYGYTRLTFTDELTTCFHEVPEPGRVPGDHRTGTTNIRLCDAP
ncbi:MAG: metallophosphoesterase [Proteobacteria bacterium]|nr:metallophosphoesterase [Pseudomonadota bacterium]